MTNQEICDLYDSRPDLTLVKLSIITGLSVPKLKQILMEGDMLYV